MDTQYKSLTNNGETNDKQYFRRNVPAAYFLAQGDKFSPDETFHRVTTYVTVTADEGSETGSLELGIRKEAEGGRVYVDNISLYYIGNEDEHLSFGVDAYGDESSVDTYTYEKEYYFNLSRKFNLNQSGARSHFRLTSLDNRLRRLSAMKWNSASCMERTRRIITKYFSSQ